MAENRVSVREIFRFETAGRLFHGNGVFGILRQSTITFGGFFQIVAPLAQYAFNRRALAKVFDFQLNNQRFRLFHGGSVTGGSGWTRISRKW